MIYELSLVANANTGSSELAELQKIVHQVVKDSQGEILIEDDWGKLTLAQPTARGVKEGRYLYYLYKASNQANKELTRRFGINENHVRSMIVVVGEDSEQDVVAKAYKTPFSKRYNGSVAEDDDSLEEDMIEVEEGGEGGGKGRRRFARRRTCWFTEKGIRADWKDPKTYSWLVNEFGKISPARVSGISRKHHRFAELAIKRARQVGLSSRISNAIAEG